MFNCSLLFDYSTAKCLAYHFGNRFAQIVCRRKWRWWAPLVPARTCSPTWWVASECLKISFARSHSSRIFSRRSWCWTQPSGCQSITLWLIHLSRREFNGGMLACCICMRQRLVDWLFTLVVISSLTTHMYIPCNVMLWAIGSQLTFSFSLLIVASQIRIQQHVWKWVMVLICGVHSCMVCCFCNLIILIWQLIVF